jgi:hypothetical protein
VHSLRTKLAKVSSLISYSRVVAATTAAGLSLILFAFVVVGVHRRCPRLALSVILTCCCNRRLWLDTVGDDLGLANDPGPSAVGAVTLELHMPAAVWAAALLLAQVSIEVT